MVETAKLEELSGYSACDISDALLKLKVPGAGFLPDILPLTSPTNSPSKPIVAPISTILFAPKSLSPSDPSTTTPSTTSPASTNPTTSPSTTTSPSYPPTNIPKQTHWTDLPTPGHIALLQQPPNQSCAVLGDILATRLKVRGVRGVVVDGRVRDVRALGRLCGPSSEGGEGRQGEGKSGEVGGKGEEGEMNGGNEFVIWNKAISTVGTGMEAQAWAWDVRIRIGGVGVDAGDILFADPEDRGVVVIPRDKVDAVLELLPKLKVAEERVIEDVERGVDVQEAFRRHRGT